MSAAAVLTLSGCSGKKENERSDIKAMEAMAEVVDEETTIVETMETHPETMTLETTAVETTAVETTIIETTDAETTQPETDSQPATEDYVSFLFAGDICLEEDGFVLDHFDETGGNLEQCMSPYLLERMASADLFMLNHEYSISSRGSRLDKYYTFRANPERMDILKQMSVDIVSLANNHVYDYGFDAFSDTISLLDQAGIRHVGAGFNQEEAEQVEYFDVRGIRIGVVSASRAEKYVITPQAKGDKPGVFWMYDHDRLKEVTAEAASQCDFLVAYLHWGTEDSEYFEDYQHNIAEELVECGVDAIIGGHPHIVQGMEFLGDVPVMYSLGDFWFNGSDKYSIMIQLNIYKDGSCTVEIIPCRQKDYCIYAIKDSDGQTAFFDYLSRLSPGVSFG